MQRSEPISIRTRRPVLQFEFMENVLTGFPCQWQVHRGWIGKDGIALNEAGKWDTVREPITTNLGR